nr:MAG TPA: hypothetical protein [Caudoviricetes sp.]
MPEVRQGQMPEILFQLCADRVQWFHAVQNKN